jgi:hypothetical protein
MLHDQVKVLLNAESLKKFDYVSMRKLFQNLSLLINLINFVRWLERLRYINSFNRYDLTSFLVERLEYFAESALAQQLIQLVLVNYLRHIEGSPVWLQVKLVSILNKVNVVILNQQTC